MSKSKQRIKRRMVLKKRKRKHVLLVDKVDLISKSSPNSMLGNLLGDLKEKILGAASKPVV